MLEGVFYAFTVHTFILPFITILLCSIVNKLYIYTIIKNINNMTQEALEKHVYEMFESMLDTDRLLLDRIERLEHIQEINERDIEKLQDELETLKNK